MSYAIGSTKLLFGQIPSVSIGCPFLSSLNSSSKMRFQKMWRVLVVASLRKWPPFVNEKKESIQKVAIWSWIAVFQGSVSQFLTCQLSHTILLFQNVWHEGENLPLSAMRAWQKAEMYWWCSCYLALLEKTFGTFTGKNLISKHITPQQGQIWRLVGHKAFMSYYAFWQALKHSGWLTCKQHWQLVQQSNRQ